MNEVYFTFIIEQFSYAEESLDSTEVRGYMANVECIDVYKIVGITGILPDMEVYELPLIISNLDREILQFSVQLYVDLFLVLK